MYKLKASKKNERINRKDRLMNQEALKKEWDSTETKTTLIQMLIPLGLERIEEELQKEVMNLVGRPYQRGGQNKRWGVNPGSVFLGDQKVSIQVPRVRNIAQNAEISLNAYQELQSSQRIDSMVLSRVINGITQGKYSKAIENIPATFGIKKTSVSRKFIRASSKKLQELMSRDLSQKDIISIFMDGKTFGENGLIIALGVTLEGEKVVLGFIESGTENHMVCKDFFNDLLERGLNQEHKILFVIDGARDMIKSCG